MPRSARLCPVCGQGRGDRVHSCGRTASDDAERPRSLGASFLGRVPRQAGRPLRTLKHAAGMLRHLTRMSVVFQNILIEALATLIALNDAANFLILGQSSRARRQRWSSFDTA